MIESLLIALLPVPVLYLIYFRHFFAYYREEGKTPAYLKHLESLLFGIALALAIIIAGPLINSLLLPGSVVTDAFIKAALVEKLGALLVVYLIQRHYPSFNTLEGVVSGVLVGCGFSLVENIFYTMNYGHSVIIVRTLFSVPLHLTTCGLIGYFVAASSLSSTRTRKLLNIARAFMLPFILHGIFDLLLLIDGSYSYLIGPLVIIMVGTLELFITRAKIFPSRKYLSDQILRFEDWLLEYRQPRYERWILNSMGTASNDREPFFRARRGTVLWLMVIGLFVMAGAFFPLGNEITTLLGLYLKYEEQILIVSVYPLSIGLILSMVGSINPAFFTSSVVRIPIIFDAVICCLDDEESLVTFDITLSNCFLRTSEPLGAKDGITVFFESRHFKSPRVDIRVVWENHQENRRNEPTGTIVEVINPGPGYYLFLARYYMFRIFKGVVFNLKLPGFQAIRMLFMRPATVMQKEVVYHPGAVVFREGDKVNSFYLIKKGKVNFYKSLDSGDRVFLESMEEGQIFNEMALLGDTRRSVTVECVTRCVLAVAQADNLEALIRHNPDFAMALVRKLAHRADQTQGELTQSIDYLQKLLQVKTRRSRNAALLLVAALEHRSDEVGYRLELDTGTLGSISTMSTNDIINYIMHSLLPDDSSGDPIPQGMDKEIEKIMLSAKLEFVHAKKGAP